MKKIIKNTLLSFVVIIQITIIFWVSSYFFPPITFMENLYLIECDELTEKDTIVLNDFFLYTEYNGNAEYWCNIKRINNYIFNENRVIPKEIGKLSNLKELDLGNKNLIGEIPKEIGKLKKLKRLNLSNNNLIGELPKELGNIKSLKFLYLSGNGFNGTFPKEIEKLQNLIHLDLSNNKFDGEFLTEIPKLDKLLVLDLSKNNFTGNIPENIFKRNNKCILFLCFPF